ncbi:MAG: Cell division protein CrgA, partial [uncultured Frankineae bacterium]
AGRRADGDRGRARVQEAQAGPHVAPGPQRCGRQEEGAESSVAGAPHAGAVRRRSALAGGLLPHPGAHGWPAGRQRHRQLEPAGGLRLHHRRLRAVDAVAL